MNLDRLVSQHQNANFSIRIAAWAETGGSFELAITDEFPSGYIQGKVEINSKVILPRQPLTKGRIRIIENHVLQSGVLDLPEKESEGPVVINGIEYQLLDGVHHSINIFWRGQNKRIERFHKPESSFSRLYNSVIDLSIREAPSLQPVARLLCNFYGGDTNAG